MLGADKQTLTWDSAAPAAGSDTVHDVIRGTLDVPVAESAELCLGPGLSGNTTVDTETPDSGEGFWYLVRGRNVCGPGTYGLQSDGTPRTSLVCP